ncbi:MAG: hypothetical protein KY459_13655 [Acidobacteria bacterium]|nr:hypothetical protein [Acidobacteriota bacterium]
MRSEHRSWHGWLGALVFALLVLTGIQPFFAGVWGLDRLRLEATLNRHLETRSPDLEPFLGSVLSETAAGERLLFVADPESDQGWPRMRAVYRLHDRNLTLADPGGEPGRADAIATWKTSWRPSGYRLVFSHGEGRIYRPEDSSR